VLQAEDNGGLTVFEGERGCGKAMMMDFLFELAVGADVSIYRVCSSPENVNEPFAPWQQLLSHLLGCNVFVKASERESHVLALVADNLPSSGGVDWVSMTPLLNPLLSLSLPESKYTKSLELEADRFNGLKTIVVEILRWRMHSSPIGLCFENLQFVDHASLLLLQFVCKMLPALCVVCTASCGFVAEWKLSPAFQQGAISVVVVKLGPLSQAEIRQVCACTPALSLGLACSRLMC